MKPLRVAFLTTDGREVVRAYDWAQPAFGPAPDAVLQGLAGCPEVEVHVVCCLQQPAPAPVQLAPNVFYHALTVPKWGWLRTAYLGCVRAVRARFRSIRPDLVHGQGTERDCGLCAVLSGHPNLLTIHGNMRAVARSMRARPLSFYWLSARLERLTLPRTQGVMCNSEYTESQVRPLARRVWRVPNPVRLAFFGESARPRQHPPILLSAGNILPYKHQLELLGLARRWHTAGLAFQLCFLGALDRGSDYGARFAEELRQAESLGYARHLGVKFLPELLEYFDAASALIHTSTEESFGLVVAEALARNLQIFCFRCGGLEEVTADVPGVARVAPGDWAELDVAVTAWLRRGAPAGPETQSQMKARFHPVVVARRHVEIYSSLLQPVGA